MNIFEITLTVSIAVLCVAMLLAMIRFAIGPSLADRISSLDLMSVNLIGIIIIYTMVSHQIVFMDAALIFSLIVFLGTMSFAYYLIYHRSQK